MSFSRGSSPFPLILESPYSTPYPCSPDPTPYWYLNDELMHDCPFKIKTCQGCDGMFSGHASDDGSERRSESSSPPSTTGVAYSNLRSTTPCSSIQSFNSSAATRLQLKEEFLRLYFPAGISDNETDFMFSKFLCRDMLEGTGTTSQLAIDALSLIQIGTSNSDERLIQESQSRYQAAVRSLNADLSNPDAMNGDGVLSASYVLGFCEMYRPLSPRGQPWRAHHKGLQDILVARGPSGDYSKFAQLFVYNFRHVAANAGVATRKKVSIAGRAWRRCAALTDASMALLSEQIVALPGALETADHNMQQANPSSLYDSLMELAGFERSMHAWVFRWYASFEGLPYRQENTTRHQHFQKCTSGAPKLFQKSLSFPSWSHASAQIVYWIGLLEIKQTMSKINRTFKLPILPKSEATIVSEANEIADKLCQSVAWLTQPKYGMCGVWAALGCLHYAALWYSERMDLQKIAWCQKVAHSLETGYQLKSIFSGSSRSRYDDKEEDAEFEEDDDDSSQPP